MSNSTLGLALILVGAYVFYCAYKGIPYLEPIQSLGKAKP